MEKIIEKLGNNSKTYGFIPCIKYNNVSIDGLYTFSNSVYILSEGNDIPFISLDNKLKSIIIEYVNNKKYKLDNTI